MDAATPGGPNRDCAAATLAVAEPAASRREALRRGAAAGGALLAGSVAGALLSVRDALAAAQDDATILSRAVSLENTAVAAYEAALQSGLLDRRVRAVVELFHRHEREHADALSAALKAMGGAPPTAPEPKVLAPMQRVRTQAGLLQFAIALETMAIAGYHDAQRKLRDPTLLQTGSQIMAGEGQHLVVLRQTLGRNPVPHAFETGKA